MAERATVVAELERIRAKRGALTARAVWEESIDEAAPLHDRFTWDDTKAAELFRDQEARCVIHGVTVTDGARAGARAYYHVIVDDEPRYEPLEIVVATESMYLFALKECEIALNAAKKRIIDLTGSTPTIKKIDASLRSVRKLQREHRAEA